MCRIEKNLEIDAPVEECYRILRKFEDYPRILQGIDSMRQKGDPSVWEWKVTADQFNRMFQGDIQLDGLRHNPHIISWHTIRETDLPHSGAITLHELDQYKTRLHFVMEFVPVPGLPEDEVIQFVEQSVETGLQTFKQHMSGIKTP